MPALVAGWLAAPASVGAQTEVDYPTATLVWSAPAGCATANEVRDAVTGRLARRAFWPAEEAELRVRVEVTESASPSELSEDGAEPERFSAELWLEAASDGRVLGTRSLVSENEDCRTLDDPVAVVLALMLNVRREDLELDAPAAVVDEPARSIGVRGALEAGPVFGLLPETAGELALALRVEPDPGVGIGLELATMVAAPVGAMEGTLSVGAASARLMVEPVLVRGVVSLYLRAGFGAGPMWAGTSGFDVGRTQVLPFLEVRAGLGFSARIAGPLSFDLVADASLHPLRPTFYLQEGENLIPLFTPLLGGGAMRAGFSLSTD